MLKTKTLWGIYQLYVVLILSAILFGCATGNTLINKSNTETLLPYYGSTVEKQGTLALVIMNNIFAPVLKADKEYILSTNELHKTQLDLPKEDIHGDGDMIAWVIDSQYFVRGYVASQTYNGYPVFVTLYLRRILQ